jgi:enoyl-CoA hydratase/carnithine racemase
MATIGIAAEGTAVAAARGAPVTLSEMTRDVLYGVAGGVATITINRPERRNAVAPETIAGLREMVARAGRDPAVRVVVVTGAGDKAFCAGFDLATMTAGAGALALHDHRGEVAGLFGQLWALGKPTIARVRGFCLAGGFGLALACDLVVAADDAVFATPEVDIGLWPFQVTVPMLRSMPPKRALELMLTGRRVDAAEAERIGFVTRVVEAAGLDAAVAELAATLAAKPPGAVRLGRDSFYRVLDQSAEDALAHLHAMLTVLTTTDDAAEGIAAFAEKRPPRWSGR